jgi:hypothetical protein
MAGIGHVIGGYRVGELHGEGRIEHGYFTGRAELSTGVARVEEGVEQGAGGGESTVTGKGWWRARKLHGTWREY